MSEPHRMRLRNGIRTVNGITGETEPTYGEYVLASDYDALASEVAALRRDAERYRWLRDSAYDVEVQLRDCEGDVACLPGETAWSSYRGPELDAAIDAATGADHE